MKKLKDLGLEVIDNVNDVSEKVIIRAHGISNTVYKSLEKLGVETLDFTCPNVLRIHNLAKEYSKKGYYLFLIGIKNHPENIGTISYCGKNSSLIENEDDIDIDIAISLFNKSRINKLAIIVQTTFNLEVFSLFVEKIKSMLWENVTVAVENTICNSTKIRQNETYDISKQVQCMIIVGGKNSSNTKKLFDIAKENCSNTFWVESKDELDINCIKKFDVIGVMAGASTPDYSIKGVIDNIKDKTELI
jgi:4-hydroxy-3-methylbut-2-enyl diphosphate reductase